MIFFIPRTKNQFIVFVVIIGLATGYYYYYEDSKLSNFKNMYDLKSFLASDKTDKLIWTEDFTCEDFTNTLIENAKIKGYRLKPVSVNDPNALWPNEKFYWVGDGGHALCIAYVESEGKWYYIEPQNDAILGVYEK